MSALQVYGTEKNASLMQFSTISCAKVTAYFIHAFGVSVNLSMVRRKNK
jgi:hypothetical protein